MTTIELTTSAFLNSVLSEYSFGNVSNIAKKFKNLATNDVDKWCYNQLVSDDKFEISFDPAKYQDTVFTSNVHASGKSDTDYGEFVRAFNKLAYRWFNDGDCPISGPYSALNYFLKDAVGSRKFGWDGEEFHLHEHSKIVFGDDYDIESEYESRFNGLIMYICKGIMLWEASYTDRNSEVKKFCDSFTVLIDQLHDDIKGKERCYKSCDNYYKNVLEFEYPDIYKWLCETFDDYRWKIISTDLFENHDEHVDVTIYKHDKFTLRFENSIMQYCDRSSPIEIVLDKPQDDKFIETLKKLYVISNEYYKQEKTQFLTLKEYLTYFDPDKIGQMLLVREHGKIILKPQ